MKLFLVRHGESNGNANQSMYFKELDSELEITDKGQEQSKEAGNKIVNILNSFKNEEYPNEDTIFFNTFNSTYIRATQTANILSDHISRIDKYHVSKLIPTPLCREREWGSLRSDIRDFTKLDKNYLFNFYYKPTGGESFADCFTRVAVFHQWLLTESKYEYNIVVSHGEFIKLYLMFLLKWDINEFDKWNTPRNGEVFLIDDGELSSVTPLTINTRKR
jgi:broad specificity phosphatase PhoE